MDRSAVGPRYDTQAAIDAAMVHSLRAGIAGSTAPSPMLTRRPLAVLAALGRRGDRLAAEAFARVDNLLVEPGEVLADPRIRTRLDRYADHPWWPDAATVSRDEFVTVVTVVTVVAGRSAGNPRPA